MDILHPGGDGEARASVVLGDQINLQQLCTGINQLKCNFGNSTLNVILCDEWYEIDLVKSHECLVRLWDQLHRHDPISHSENVNLQEFLDTKFDRSARWGDCVKGWRGPVGYLLGQMVKPVRGRE